MPDKKQNQERKTSPDLSRLAEAGKSAPRVSEKTAEKPEISFEKISGKKILHYAPVKTETPVSFENIGGKVVRKSSEHPANVKPDAPEEKDESEDEGGME